VDGHPVRHLLLRFHHERLRGTKNTPTGSERRNRTTPLPPARDLGGPSAHRFGGEGRRGLEGGDHDLVGHAVPALAAASPEHDHLRRRGRGGRVGGGGVGFEDVGERQPAGAVDGEAVGALPAVAAGRHLAGERGRRGGDGRPGTRGGRVVTAGKITAP
jgi:hypothetical protein